jgi:hypothetical protein
MATPEPVDSSLWLALTAYVDWPAGDEDRLPGLGTGWTDAGTSFLYAGSSTNVPGGEAWTDEAGEAYRAKVLEIQDKVITNGQALERLGRLATAYGEDVAYAKAAIAEFVRAWEPYFVAEPATVEPAAAADVTTFLNGMAERIAARGAGGPADPELPRPELVTPAEVAQLPPQPPQRPGEPGRQPPPEKVPFPKDLIPPGGKARDVGEELWGHGPDIPKALLGTRTPEQLRQLMSKEDALRLQEFYADVARRIPSNPTAATRVRLLQEVIDAWS